MPEAELRALFTAGPKAALTAHQAFTNRVSELAAFDEAVAAMSANLELHRLAVVDLSRPRTNVLTYFGTGGIGKTALSRKLQHLAELPDSSGQSLPTARIDFDNGTPFDLEAIVVALRASVWRLKSRWDAFDIAFRLYWERAHPGENLQDFIRRLSLVRRMAGSFDIGDQLIDASEATILALTDVSSVATSARRLAAAIYTSARTSRTTKDLRRECPYFESLLEASASEETLSYLSSLLAWDLARFQRDTPAVPVVFIDTFEALSSRATRDAERLLQRVIYLAPNVLFVITGRDRLDWADRNLHGELDYSGSDRWPNLVQTNADLEPRQHRVGYLSANDCESFLCSVTDASGATAISRPIRDKISDASGGWPLYLDLAVGYFLDVVGRGKTPTIDDFGGPLPAVVARTMRDLSAEERALMRAVALVDAFDEDLARAGAGTCSDAALVRFVRRSFIEYDSSGVLPFALHASLREAVLEADADHIVSDAWSETEWDGAARRLLEDLGRRFAAGSRERGLLSFLLSQGLRLAAQFDVLPDWLLNASEEAVELGLWRALMTTVDDIRTTADAFCYGVGGLALRRHDLDEAIARLERALASSPDDREREFLAVHLSHALRNRGRYPEAEEQYEKIVRSQGRYSDIASFQLTDIAYLRGRFGQALRRAATRGDESAYLRGEKLRLVGHIRRVHADFAAAESAYHEVLDVASELGSLSLDAKALTNLVETYCWLAPERSERLLDRAWQANQTIGNRLELLKLHAADGVAQCKKGNAGPVEEAVVEALALVEATHYEAGRVFALTPRAFQFALDNDSEGLGTLVEEMRTIADRLGVYAFWAEIFSWWRVAIGGKQVLLGHHGARWIGGAPGTHRRWLNVLEARQ